VGVSYDGEVECMSKTLTEELTSEEAELKAAIEKIFVEIGREHETMKRDQEEIERSRERTRKILARLKADVS
jgi:serine phosphatase RsbU (regulator of sigma subunit)